MKQLLCYVIMPHLFRVIGFLLSEKTSFSEVARSPLRRAREHVKSGIRSRITMMMMSLTCHTQLVEVAFITAGDDSYSAGSVVTVGSTWTPRRCWISVQSTDWTAILSAILPSNHLTGQLIQYRLGVQLNLPWPLTLRSSYHLLQWWTPLLRVAYDMSSSSSSWWFWT